MHIDFPRCPLCVSSHMLTVIFSPVFLSFRRNRATQLLAYFCLFCWFWCVFSPQMEVPPELPILKLSPRAVYLLFLANILSPKHAPVFFFQEEWCPWKCHLPCWRDHVNSYRSSTWLRPCQWTWHLWTALLKMWICPQISKHSVPIRPYPGVTVMEMKHLFRSGHVWQVVLLFISSAMNTGRVLVVATATHFLAIRTTQLAVLLICHLLMAW